MVAEFIYRERTFIKSWPKFVDENFYFNGGSLVFISKRDSNDNFFLIELSKFYWGTGPLKKGDSAFRGRTRILNGG